MWFDPAILLRKFYSTEMEPQYIGIYVCIPLTLNNYCNVFLEIS